MLICQLTDLHVRPFGQASNRVSETNMLTARAFRAVSELRPRPDVVLITGDLTECGLPAEYAMFRTLLEQHLDMPVYVVPGNHDRRENFRAALGQLPGVTEDAEFVQYAFDAGPVRIVMLDTVVPGAGHGALTENQLAWLDRTLAAEPRKPTLIGMHHPPFACGILHMDKIALRDPGGFRAVIERHPQVQQIICGHHHRPITARFGHAVASIAPSVSHQVELALKPDAPPALNFEPPAFQLHLWTEVDGFVSHVAYVERYPGPFPFLTDPDYPGQA